MKSLRVKNLRSFKDVNIELSPVNVLVGENSSGKSTFLRIFPLIKQSLNRDLSGPILWNSNDGVDFGSYRISCNPDEDLKLSFKTEISNPVGFWHSTWGEDVRDKKIEVELEISISNKGDYNDYIKQYTICFLNRKIEIVFDESHILNKYIVDGRVYNLEARSSNSNGESKAIFNKYTNYNINYAYNLFNEKIMDRETKFKYIEGTVFYLDDIKFFMYALFNHRFLGLEKDKILNGLIIEESDEVKFKKIIDRDDERMDDLLFLNIIDSALDITLKKIKNVFDSSVYIAPIRAVPSRYHRIINLSTNEVDSKGENVAMVLNSLSPDKMHNLEEFMTENLGFSVSIKRIEDNVSIEVTEKGSNIKKNIVDTGTGYSQILPIAIQLWKLQYDAKPNADNKMIILIEQPELHLHPALQASLTDLIINITNKHKDRLSFVLETHSDTIVNRIGELIYKEKIDNKDVSVNVFRKINDETQNSIAKYDDEGYLENWPIGFFTPEMIE